MASVAMLPGGYWGYPLWAVVVLMVATGMLCASVVGIAWAAWIGRRVSRVDGARAVYADIWPCELEAVVPG